MQLVGVVDSTCILNISIINSISEKFVYYTREYFGVGKIRDHACIHQTVTCQLVFIISCSYTCSPFTNVLHLQNSLTNNINIVPVS